MIKKVINNLISDVEEIAVFKEQRWIGVFLFNIIIILLLLLYTAGYFSPYFPLTVNFIVLVGIVLSVILLRVRSRTIFLIALLFWGFAAFLKIFRIEIWAERTAIYTFECLIVGFIVSIIETRNKKNG